MGGKQGNRPTRYQLSTPLKAGDTEVGGDVPDDLSPLGLELWRALDKAFGGSFDVIDRVNFVVLCQHLSDWERAGDDIRVNGTKYESPGTGTIKANPALTERHAAATRYNGLLRTLGLAQQLEAAGFGTI